MTEFRWTQVDAPRPRSARPGSGRAGGGGDQGQLFDEPIFEREPGRGEYRGMEFLHVRAHRIINEVRNAPYGFRWSINAYRGCSHACTYCFARPTHTYLGLDAERDFERRIVVKVNAVARLRAELDPRRWRGELIAMGTNTDPYQRCEGKYRLTRGIVEALAEHGNPFSILTKSTLVLRDLSLLASAARQTSVRVNLSIGTLDEDVWRATEPGTPHPRRRLRAVEQLNAAGVPCGVLMGPVLPDLSDDPAQVEAVVKGAIEAGAQSVSAVMLHLRPGVREVFLPRLAQTHPHLLAAYRRRYRNRATAPRADQADLDALVRDLVGRHGGSPAPGGDAGDAGEGPAGAPARGAADVAPDEGSHQLSLL